MARAQRVTNSGCKTGPRIPARRSFRRCFMPLPEKSFFTVEKLAGEWKIPAADIGNYAVTEQLTLSIVLSTNLIVRPADSEPEGSTVRLRPGIVSVFGADVWPAFKGEVVALTRIRGDADTVLEIQPETQSPLVSLIDLIVRSEEKLRFEVEYNIDLNIPPPTPRKLINSRQGRPPEYKWEECLYHLFKHIFEFGVPETQAELVRFCLDWFAQNDAEIPEISNVEKRVRKFWRILHGQ